ncbi:outer membrane transport energization protein TonB [Sphingobacterium allocomposti]|uniref:Outer membrane transport energization protein TonB n=1 Tax=Sphingobacterium allocomposti TaxID=415956 RepID=A0A5S5DRZ0_9SPHI|nr:energy transducer TonB [Sphingobacterium composti Yoo et al. 2007 non Ten et al. 2007]TYP97632.1 outer membrane transport energization protein TonB [Sphingobacterium composti Yoo et al. 2007 non Ten et al. 2007]
MMWKNKLDIYEKEWLDVIFSSCNQNYGAYDLRCYASLATNKALLAVISVVTLLVCWKAAYDRMPKEVGAVTPERVVSVTMDMPVENDPPAKEDPLPMPESPAQRISEVAPAQELVCYVEPVIAAANRVTEDLVSNNQLKDKMSARISLKPVKGGSFVAKGEFGPKKAHGAITGGLTDDVPGGGGTSESAPFTSVEIMPMPPGGTKAFIRWVGHTYRYPDKALEQQIKGSVVVSFVVEKDGTLTDMKVVRDLGFGTGEEALRVLRKAARWSPGVQNGRAVRVSYTLPITLSSL